MGDPRSVLLLTGLTSVNAQSLTHIGCDTSLCIGFHIMVGVGICYSVGICYVLIVADAG